jgi:hypothetical protein
MSVKGGVFSHEVEKKNVVLLCEYMAPTSFQYIYILLCDILHFVWNIAVTAASDSVLNPF